MSHYVPNEFFSFSFSDPSSSSSLLDNAIRLLEKHTPYRVWDRWRSPRGTLGILNVSMVAAPARPSYPEALVARFLPRLASLPSNRLEVEGDRALLKTGYVSGDERSWRRSIRDAGGRLRCEDAGGIAAFCSAHFGVAGDEKLYLWSTRPGLRTVAYAGNSNMLVAGTRPRLVALLARDFSAASLDHQYLRDSLVGWSLGDRTPYEGTSLVSVDSLLRIEAGVASLHEHPTPRYERRAEGLLRVETNRYRRALRTAVAPLRAVEHFELRMSGGKDSRLLAAALSDSGITPSTVVCHGLEGEWETPVAQRISSALGWQIKFVVPEFGYRGGIADTVRHNLALSDGFLATEALQVTYPQFHMSGDAGPGLALGHIELQRGGWAKSMKTGLAEALRYATVRMTPLRDMVVPELCQPVSAALDEFMQSVPVTDAPEYLYGINYRFRVCRWLTSHYLVHSKELLPIYPLVDEHVAREVSSTPLAHLTSERLVFSAMRKMAPQLARIPLFRERYRFEMNKPSKAFSAHYDERAPFEPVPSTHRKYEVSMSGAIESEICAHIRDGRLRDLLKDATNPVVWKAIEKPGRGRLAKLEVPQKSLRTYLWTCYQASVLATDGLDELAPSGHLSAIGTDGSKHLGYGTS